MYLITAAVQALALISFLRTDFLVVARDEETSSPVPVTTEFLPAHFFPELESKRVKVNYGQVDVPSMHEDGGMIGSYVQVPLPCSNCLVTWIQAGLEYTDGSRADADTGMWLHHTVFSNHNRPNRVCPGEKPGDWFFASGNERSEINLCESGRSRAGYHIGSEDKMSALTDLMNMRGYKQTVALTVTWEYIPIAHCEKEDFAYLTPYWLDIGGCDASEMPAKPDAHFHYSMPTKTAQFPGEVKMMVGHLHDGGTRLDVLWNDEVVCSMDAEYSTYGSDDEQHLSGISNCSNVGSISPGDVYSITAHYDTTLHKPMMEHDGELEPIMGIVLAYVAEENPNMDDGKRPHHHHRRRHHHVLATIGATCVVFGAMIVLGHWWLKKRGETVMDYVPERLRRSGWINLDAFNRRIMLRGERAKDPLLDNEAMPAYRDNE